MKKIYEAPDMYISMFDAEDDIIIVSGTGQSVGEASQAIEEEYGTSINAYSVEAKRK